MATNKAKRPILLAQPRPQHAKTARAAIPDRAKAARSGNPGAGSPRLERRKTNLKSNADPKELMPVKAYVYRAIAELNAGFEKVVQELQTLRSVNYFSAERVAAMRDLICRARARANRDFTTAMREREQANASYFEIHKKEIAG